MAKVKKKEDVVAVVVDALLPFLIPINSLTPDPANARTHGDRNLEAIESSLRRFGQDQLIVVQKQGMVVRKGNGRLEAAKRLGWTHVAAVVVDESNVEATARAIADNRSSDLAGWNDVVLGKLLKSMAEDGAKIDDLGWSADELRLAIGSADGSLSREPQSPQSFREVDEGIEVEYKCPRCSYEWSGKPK